MNEMFAQWAEYMLMWVGFGTLVGLLAKALLPGKDPGGALATVILGIMGSIIGAGTLAYFSENLRVTPLSPVGFLVAIAGTTLLLLSYRMVNGSLLRHGVAGFQGKLARRRISVTEEK